MFFSLKGTIPQYGILQGHLERETTQKAAEADKIISLIPSEKLTKLPIENAIMKSSSKLNGKIAGFMINVFSDAKKLTLSAWSWPSCQVANMMAASIDVHKEYAMFDAPKSSLQYITTVQHKNFLCCFVMADRERIKDKSRMV